REKQSLSDKQFFVDCRRHPSLRFAVGILRAEGFVFFAAELNMDDVKDKVKGLMKKVNNPFSSNTSSGKFKGQGRVLGSSSVEPPPSNPIRPRIPESKPLSSSSSSVAAVSKPSSASPSLSNSNHGKKTTLPPPPSSDSHISSNSNNNESNSIYSSSITSNQQQNKNISTESSNQQLLDSISSFVSGGVSVDIVLKLFKNIIKEPENPKFRRIRLSNPKIREAVVEVAGGVELLECVGFSLQEEAGEMWAVIIQLPSDQQLSLINQAVSLLEPQPQLPSGFSIRRSPETPLLESEKSKQVSLTPGDEPEQPQKIDRQVRVFFSAAESNAAKIDQPDSFYSLSASELKREADARKKQIAESQLLIPKSYKERKAKEARKKYKTTTIRVQFPDEVVLQGVFLPWEPTTALYEFVSSSLKEPCLEFELWRPAVPKPRVIPRFPSSRERTPTLDDEELVPSALIKFKPIETDSIVFTGLSNALLEISETSR
ncbi:Ubx domain-containing protein, partial [Thalictrum thalictroides]